MAKTLTEIATSVLQNIGRLPDGQSAPGSQLNIIKDSYAGLYNELLNDSLVSWAETDDIPDFATDTIIQFLSGRVSRIFGVQNEWTVAWEQRRALRMKLGKQISNPYVSNVTQFENF